MRDNNVFDFIKMVIEVAEKKSLSGAKLSLTSENDLKLEFCIFHNYEDADNI